MILVKPNNYKMQHLFSCLFLCCVWSNHSQYEIVGLDTWLYKLANNLMWLASTEEMGSKESLSIGSSTPEVFLCFPPASSRHEMHVYLFSTWEQFKDSRHPFPYYAPSCGLLKFGNVVSLALFTETAQTKVLLYYWVSLTVTGSHTFRFEKKKHMNEFLLSFFHVPWQKQTCSDQMIMSQFFSTCPSIPIGYVLHSAVEGLTQRPPPGKAIFVSFCQ